MSKYVFIEPDERKINQLFHHLLSRNKISNDCYETTAHHLKENNYEQAYLFTGFPIGEKFETDGPVGTIILADTLVQQLMIPLVTIAVPAGLDSIISKIIDNQSSDTQINVETIEDVRIKANRNTLAIAIEYPGPNNKDVLHNMRGEPINDYFNIGLIWRILLGLPTELVTTIAIGDGGNELGLGEYETEIREMIPYGESCKCGCQGGIASHLKANFALLATTSNWGAIGLAKLLGGQISYDKYFRLLNKLVSLGVIDGVSKKPSPTTDSIAIPVEKKIVEKIANFTVDE